MCDVQNIFFLKYINIFKTLLYSYIYFQAYLFHLAHDPNSVVRRTIVKCIGATRKEFIYLVDKNKAINSLSIFVFKIL